MEYQKQIKILDEEKQMFNAIWYAWEQNPEDEFRQRCLKDIIEFLSRQYDFDPHNFTLFDKEGKLIHRRVPRNKPTEKLN